jgi:pyruvate dehydrogenase E1 component alpha subunit
MKGLPHIAVGICGDGATNHGTFHECLNMAAAWDLPLVCLVENNQYAISVRFADVTATAGIAERAAAYGALGRRVDGADVEEVVRAFAEIAKHTRKGGGPSLLEATCYRHRGHYEGDHDNYRERAEKQRMRAEMDPIARYRRVLIERGIAESDLEAVVTAANDEMGAMLADVRKDAMPDPAGAMDHVFAEVV